MTGPEHFREAERLLAESERSIADGARVGIQALDAALEVSAASIAAAQVHATLALAAATASAQATAYDGDEDHSRSRGWAGVA